MSEPPVLPSKERIRTLRKTIEHFSHRFRREGGASSETVQELAEAAALLKTLESPDETSSQPTFVYAGNVFGTDDEGDVLVEWSNERKPEVGTLLFMRLWTQAEIEAAHKAGEELHRGLAQETGRELTFKDFGYAPGNYTCKCLDCDQEFVGDKRASRCETCAAQALRENRSGAQKASAPQLEPIYVAGPGTPIIGHREVHGKNCQCGLCKHAHDI